MFLADGTTTMSMPDTPETQVRHSAQIKTVKAGLGFPIMRAVDLISLATGAVVDFDFAAFEGKGTGEGTILRGMLDSVKRDSILVADRYYPSYIMVGDLLERGVDMISVSHVSRKVDFNEGIQLGKNDPIVEWHKPAYTNRMDREAYDRLPETISVREFVIEIDSREGGKENAIVISTITDPTVPQDELSDLYWRSVDLFSSAALAVNQAVDASRHPAMQDAGNGREGSLLPLARVQSASRHDDRIGEAQGTGTATNLRERDNAGRRIIHAGNDGDKRWRRIV